MKAPSFFPRAIAALIFALLVSTLAAQVDVQVKMNRNQFIANEGIPLSVEMTNRAGRELTLYGDGKRPWLDVIVSDRRGTLVAPRGGQLNFQAAKIPVGRAVARQVNLASLFPLAAGNRYTAYVIVTLPTGETRRSNAKGFQVSNGQTIFEQRIGAGAKARDYRLITFAPSEKALLYFQAELVDERRIATTYPIGEILRFRTPEAVVDQKGRLNVLFLSAPERHIHVLIDSQGRVADRTIYKQGPRGNPRLVSFANGEVKVAGGVVHDPTKLKKQREKLRDITDRPPFTYN